MSTIEIHPSGENSQQKVSQSIFKALAQSELPVSEAVSKLIVYCSPETSLCDAAKIMTRSGCSSILIKENDKYIGIWTEFDALKIDFAHPYSYKLPISKVMSSPVMTISNSLTMREVAVEMRMNKVRHFLVLDQEKKPYAIVTQTDIVLTPAVEHYLKMQRVSSVLYHAPIIVDEKMKLSKASNQMQQVKADAIIVTYSNGAYGIITERDLTRFIAKEIEDQEVGELASKPLKTAQDSANLYDARIILEENKIRHLGIVNKNGQLMGVIGFADILSSMEFVYIQELSKILRERNKALDYVEQQLTLFERVIETTNDGVCFIDLKGYILNINPSFSEVTGYTLDDIIDKRITMFRSNSEKPQIKKSTLRTILSKGSWQGEIDLRKKNGENLPARMMVNEVVNKSGKRVYFIAMVSDLTHIKEKDEQVRMLSYYNPLTNLPNRDFLLKELEQMIYDSKSNKSSFSLMLIDLNRFRRIIETMGKSASDHLLKIISGRLHDTLRETDLLGHIGPDEFVLIFDNISNLENIQQLVERIIKEVEKPIHYNDEPMIITCRVGVTTFPQDGNSAQDLISNVYTAAMKAKQSVNNMYQFFSQYMNMEMQKQVKLENDLRHAVTENEFLFYYQPIVDAQTSEIVALEALVRWNKNGEIIPPGKFLAIAEELGLIKEIGLCTLDQLGRDYKTLRKLNKADIKIAYNISVRQFQDNDFMNKLKNKVDEYNIPAKDIILEMTESIFLDAGVENIDKLTKLREHGFQVVLDDFGTGFSSLSYLRQIPADYIKLDQSFIHELEESPESIEFIEAIVHLAHTIKLPVVAEGVESKSTAKKLVEAKCDMLQGYYFDRPAPIEDILANFVPKKL
ncbi:MAG: EAL domain-containing protein [Leptospirales bacterium]